METCTKEIHVKDYYGFWCRMYLNSCKISDLPTYKVNDLNKNGTYSDSDSERSDDDSNIAQNYEYKGKDAKRRMGKTFAAIFKMLRQPPEIDEDDSEGEFNSQEVKSSQSYDSNKNGNNSRFGSSDYDNSDFNEIQSSEKITENKRKRGKRRSIVGDLLHTLQTEKDEVDTFESDIKIEGLVRPAEKCEFHRWSMLIEKELT